MRPAFHARQASAAATPANSAASARLTYSAGPYFKVSLPYRGRTCLDAFARERASHYNVFVDFRQLAPLLDHRPGFGLYHLRADIAVHNIADLADMLFKRLAFLRDERGICSDAIDDSPAYAGSQFGQVCGIEKEFHGSVSFG